MGRSGGGRGGPGGGFGGRLRPGERPVTEEARLDIARILSDFQAGDEESYTFPPSLSNHERAVIHAECKKYGFVSRSHGKGENRRLTVSKPDENAEEVSYALLFGDPSRNALLSHAAQCPPTRAEQHAISAAFTDAARGPTGAPAAAGGRAPDGEAGAPPAKRRPRDGGRRPAWALSPDDIAQRHAAWQARVSPGGPAAQFPGIRGRLPIAEHREAILHAVRSRQALLIAGETGCGKTTQVPQYILEDCWARGEPCRVLCTQPRRISAVSVSDRVAQERGESLGGDVGYTIRFESCGGDHSSLMFCTNGVVLRMVTQGDGLAGVTHIVVDEIHERDRFADFLLVLLRDLLPSHPHLKLVLMSATLHVDLFCSYFGGPDACPVVRVPGFTHPVVDFYLEDVLKLTDYATRVGATENEMRAAVASLHGAGGLGGGKQSATVGVSAEDAQQVEDALYAAFMGGSDEDFEVLLEATGAAALGDAANENALINHQHPQTGATALMVAAGKGRLDIVQALLANGASATVASRNGMTAVQWAEQFGHAECAQCIRTHLQHAAQFEEEAGDAIAVSHYLMTKDTDEVDTDLIVQLIEYICHGAEGGAAIIDGAILVFVPGWDEILRLKDAIEARPSLQRHRLAVLPLHSMIPPADQRKVFLRPPAGCSRKVVLATNIAETAVTIDDITCVINSGRMKEKSYDAYTGVSTLQATWVSKASEKQRRGRAGRCQPGVCFHLYSRQRSSALVDFQVPEIKRCPLDELCLQTKLLDGAYKVGPVAAFLGKMAEPPLRQAVDAALALLVDIGAMDAAENLTLLGRHLAHLPLAPRIGKLVLYGVLFGVLDPILTVACASAYRDPFVVPIDAQLRRQATAARHRFADQGGGAADHMTLVAAFRGWRAARSEGWERAFCAQSFLSQATMNMIDGMRQQLIGELRNRGLAASLGAASAAAEDRGLVRAVLACGMYPQVGRLHEHDPKTMGGSASRFAQVVARNNKRVRVHQSSVNATLAPPGEVASGLRLPSLVAYEDITRGEAAMYIRR
ncbi:unnamed protein product [Pedinophyceae sp. YPF-701]|nr:unnamed protein product [Pedinophyceae sp. YPF-701]